jgi:hypothetical protein
LAKENTLVFWWYAEFLGIGYVHDRIGWNVAVIFDKPSEANQVWKEQIEPLNENSIRLSFLEDESGYKFIFYSLPLLQLPKSNFGLYRSLDISKHYLKFQEECGGKAFLRFAVLGTEPMPVLMEGSKLVTEIKFMKRKDVARNSPEWIAEEVQKRARADAKKTGTHGYIS